MAIMIKHWNHLTTRQLADTPIFKLNAHRRTSQETGREGEFYVLDASDWVNSVAISRVSHQTGRSVQRTCALPTADPEVFSRLLRKPAKP